MAEPEKVESLFTYGEVNGLTKLEILLGLEEVVIENGLYDKAKERLDKMVAENEKFFEEHGD